MTVSSPELAALLLAAATLISSLSALVVAIRGGQKIDKTHALVNGQAEAIQQLREDKGFAAGMARDRHTERADPLH